MDRLLLLIKKKEWIDCYFRKLNANGYLAGMVGSYGFEGFVPWLKQPRPRIELQ
jgi:hypothetical protein